MTVKKKFKLYITISAIIISVFFFLLLVLFIEKTTLLEKNKINNAILKETFEINLLMTEIALNSDNKRAMEQLQRTFEELEKKTDTLKSFQHKNEEAKIVEELIDVKNQLAESFQNYIQPIKEGTAMDTLMIFDHLSLKANRLYELSGMLEKQCHETINRIINNILTDLIIIVSALFMILLILIHQINREVLTPLKEFGNFLNKYNSNQLDQPIKVNKNNEIGDMKHHFNKMIDNLRRTSVSRDKLGKELYKRIQTEKELRTEKEKSDELAEKAQIADKAKSVFLTNLSHEVRTPLTGIISTLELLENEITDESQKMLIEMSHKSARELNVVFNDLYDIAKIGQDKFEVDLSQFNLKQMLNETYNMFKISAESKGLDFEFDVHHIPEQVVSDKKRIKQVLNNLIGNAVKFTMTGKVVLKVRYIKQTEEKGEIEIRISDTGVGMDEKVKEHIFEAFYQGDLGLTKEFKGLGLGIPIVGEIVNALQGEITLTSQPGKGSEFIVKLPMKNVEPSRTVEQVSDEPLENTKDINVLIVDDSIINREVIQTILKRHNINHDVAVNGQRGVEKFKQGHYTHVLMDIRMPVMDGFQAKDRVKKINPEIPIIALTVYAGTDDKKTILNNGFDDYLSKPFEAEKLISIIKKHLS